MDKDVNRAMLEKKLIAIIKEYYNNEIDDDDAESIYEKLSENFEIKNEGDLLNILSEIDPQEVETKENPKEESIEEQNLEEQKEIPEKTEPPKKEKKEKKNSKNKNKNKKKIIIILIIIGIILIAAAITLFFIFNKEDKTPKTTEEKITWKNVLKKEAKDGNLKKKIINTLNDNNIKATDINLMLLDIDSDKKTEVLVYVENKTNDKIFTYEIADKISYSKDYDLPNSNSLGYAYNMINENCYWYIDSENEKTIISIEDKEITSEDFTNNYYVLPNTYNNQNLFEQAISIDLEDEKDNLTVQINKAIKNEFTNKEFLENNDLTVNKIAKDIATKKEEEQKKLEEEEKLKEEEQKRQEEEQKALEEQKKKEEEAKNSKFKVGNYTLDYKTYVYSSSEGKETLKLNSGGNCYYKQISGQENSCTFKAAYLDFGLESTDMQWALELTLDNKERVVFQVLSNNILTDQWHQLK